MSQPEHAPRPGDHGLHLATRLHGDPAELPALRERIRGMAERTGFADRAADLTLAMAELIANAQEHGAAPVDVEVWADGRLVVEVRDRGTGLDRDTVWRSHPPSPHGRRGRGLWIVRQLMDVVLVRSGPDGTTIHVELSPDPHLGA